MKLNKTRVQKNGIKRPRKSAFQHEADSLSGLRFGLAVELTIERLDSDGIGLALHSGRQVLIPGTVPQDRCLARITHFGKTVVFADLVKLIEPSPLRLQRCPCSDAALCLGCPLIAIRYGEQLRWKQQLVQAAFDDYSSLKGIVVPRLLTPERQLQYRTTVKLAVAGTHADPYIGIYRRASHDVVDLEDCPLHHPMINTVIKVVRAGISKLKVPIYQDKNKTGILRYLVVRISESSNEVMVTFVAARRAFNEIHHLARFLQEKVPQVVVTCQNVNSSEGNVIFGAHDHFLTKQQTIQDRIGQVELLISPRSFLQAQNEGARLLYETARDWADLDGTQQVLDLYCGIGGIALTLAPVAKQVLGMELNKEAVADAKRNAKLNNAKNCHFEAGDVQVLLDDLIEDEQRFECVILNPPRKGCERDVLNKVVEVAPERIIYVSCSPQTLTRDLDILASKGYQCQKVQPVEMFPQTPHVENVALLVRNQVKTA